MAVQLPDTNTPLVFFSNVDSSDYLSAIERALQPRKVVFADRVLPQMSTRLKNDNYLIFATERAIASNAERAFQIGYRPCGKVTRGWMGTWHP